MADERVRDTGREAQPRVVAGERAHGHPDVAPESLVGDPERVDGVTLIQSLSEREGLGQRFRAADGNAV